MSNKPYDWDDRPTPPERPSRTQRELKEPTSRLPRVSPSPEYVEKTEVRQREEKTPATFLVTKQYLDEKKKKARPRQIGGAIGAIATLIASAIGLYRHSEARGEKAETNAVVKMEQQITDHDRRIGNVENKVDDVKSTVDKSDAKLDLLLNANHVPASKRPKEAP